MWPAGFVEVDAVTEALAGPELNHFRMKSDLISTTEGTEREPCLPNSGLRLTRRFSPALLPPLEQLAAPADCKLGDDFGLGAPDCS